MTTMGAISKRLHRLERRLGTAVESEATRHLRIRLENARRPMWIAAALGGTHGRIEGHDHPSDSEFRQATRAASQDKRSVNV
jgi:hypothetical protein